MEMPAAVGVLVAVVAGSLVVPWSGHVTGHTATISPWPAGSSIGSDPTLNGTPSRVRVSEAAFTQPVMPRP